MAPTRAVAAAGRRPDACPIMGPATTILGRNSAHAASHPHCRTYRIETSGSCRARRPFVRPSRHPISHQLHTPQRVPTELVVVLPCAGGEMKVRPTHLGVLKRPRARLARAPRALIFLILTATPGKSTPRDLVCMRGPRASYITGASRSQLGTNSTAEQPASGAPCSRAEQSARRKAFSVQLTPVFLPTRESPRARSTLDRSGWTPWREASARRSCPR